MNPNMIYRISGCILVWALSALVPTAVQAEDVLPVGPTPKALDFPWFPDRVHAFVWRNWELVDLPRMAAVLKTTPENVRAIGKSMGLPDHVPPTDQQWRRGYITILRRNWHLLPFEQILELLDWTPHRLAETLKEDDFLWHKLGALKPACEPLRYTEPTEAARQHAARIKALLERELGEELNKPGRPRFEFVNELSQPIGNAGQIERSAGAADEPIRLIYSYFAIYGDPLSDPSLDPYPDGLLQRLAAKGVNAVWIHTVLRDLAPSSLVPEFGVGHEKRLETLRRLVQRARKYGIDVILYMNEPRSMPPAFAKKYPDFAGVRGTESVAMCTSSPQVRQWLTESLAYVFKNVPDLGGVFTITASENLTHCASHYREASCPRCAKRSGGEIIAEVNQLIAAGVRQGNPNAKIICWDWGWLDRHTEEAIKRLPENVRVMSVSELGVPINRGVPSKVNEYCISAVGPGPRARQHWKLAQERGLAPMAKMQLNCTWELSAVPYLPVLDLVAEHCENLRTAGVKDFMFSWTLGGFPSPNLQVAREFVVRPNASREEILNTVASERYGHEGATAGRKAWSAFSKAFTEFPFDINTVYNGPMQMGPANPLYPQPTKYNATMVGFPYDDIDRWRSIYPADVMANQLSKIADGWTGGISALKDTAQAASGADQQRNAREDLIVAEAALLHFRSAANQIRFTLARNAVLADKSKAADAEKRLQQLAAEEAAIAIQLYKLTKQDPRIGFEPSNHYFYLPVDLLEKLINCRYVLDEWLPSMAARP